MTRRPPAQPVLFDFGPVTVHLARMSRVTGGPVCAECRASLAVACDWRLLDGCHDCPGLVVPVPPWALLTATDPPAHLEREAA